MIRIIIKWVYVYVILMDFIFCLYVLNICYIKLFIVFLKKIFCVDYFFVIIIDLYFWINIKGFMIFFCFLEESSRYLKYYKGMD